MSIWFHHCPTSNSNVVILHGGRRSSSHDLLNSVSPLFSLTRTAPSIYANGVFESAVILDVRNDKKQCPLSPPLHSTRS